MNVISTDFGVIGCSQIHPKGLQVQRARSGRKLFVLRELMLIVEGYNNSRYAVYNNSQGAGSKQNI